METAGEDAKGLGLGVLKAGTSNESLGTQMLMFLLPRLRNFIEYSSDLALAVDVVFGSVYCCEALEEAVSYFENNDF